MRTALLDCAETHRARACSIRAIAIVRRSDVKRVKDLVKIARVLKGVDKGENRWECVGFLETMVTETTNVWSLKPRTLRH